MDDAPYAKPRQFLAKSMCPAMPRQLTVPRPPVQHYAVKTIENVVSQGGEWAARFASESVAADLLRFISYNQNIPHLKLYEM